MSADLVAPRAAVSVPTVLVGPTLLSSTPTSAEPTATAMPASEYLDHRLPLEIASALLVLMVTSSQCQRTATLAAH